MASKQVSLNIEKIDNGFVVSVGGVKTFCSTGESICGLLAEWTLKACEELEKPQTYSDAALGIAQAQQRQQIMQQIEQLRARGLLLEDPEIKGHIIDAYKYMAGQPLVIPEPIKSDPMAGKITRE
jgi:hypothetical protein